MMNVAIIRPLHTPPKLKSRSTRTADRPPTPAATAVVEADMVMVVALPLNLAAGLRNGGDGGEDGAVAIDGSGGDAAVA